MAAPERIDRRTLNPRLGAPSVAYVFSDYGGEQKSYALKEAQALLSLGREVRLYPLRADERRETRAMLGPLSSRVRGKARSTPGFLRAGLALGLRHPLRSLGALFGLMFTHWRDPRSLFSGLTHFPKALAFGRDMQLEGVAHIHAHAAQEPTTVAWLIQRLTHIPYSFTSHAPDRAVAQAGIKAKLQGAAFAVPVSKSNHRALVDCAGAWAEDKLRLVHCGVDLEAFRAPAEGEQAELGGTATMRLNILVVADLQECSGLPVLLEALARMAKHAVPFRCRIVGMGPEQRALETLVINLGLEGKLLFLGAQSPEALRGEMWRAHVVVSTKLRHAGDSSDSVPFRLMEAMACACPVVTSEGFGMTELIANGVEGILVPVGNAEAVALALTRLWECPELRQQMGRAGLARIASEYDLRSSARRLASLFDVSLGPRPSKRPPRPHLVAS